MNETTELLPCPFCGGEARIFELRFGTGWRVLCSKSFCAQGPDGATEAEAIVAWNTRTHGTLTADQVREAIEEAKAELLESCEYVGDIYQRQSDVLKAFDKMEQAIADEMNSERHVETCDPVQTEAITYYDEYGNGAVKVHFMECDRCGGTYEHVNGAYERCPRCGKAVG